MKGSILSSITALATLMAQSASALSVPHEPRSNANLAFSRTAPHFNETVGGEAVADAAANPVYYIAWFFPPAGAHITNFVSTMAVPRLTSQPGIGPRYVWPGMENARTNFVFQDVLGDQQPQGTWSFATWFVGEGHTKEYPVTKVSTGEHVKSTFNAQSANGVNWIEKYKITGANPSSGGNDPAPFTSEGALTNALFAIELWNNAKWDFGPVTWTDISITAVTSETAWCTSPNFSAPSGVTNFRHTITTPKATKHGNMVTCTVAKLVFQAP